MAGVTSKLHKLKEDVRSFYAVAGVKRMHQPSAAEFLRDAVRYMDRVDLRAPDWVMDKSIDLRGFCLERVDEPSGEVRYNNLLSYLHVNRTISFFEGRAIKHTRVESDDCPTLKASARS
jgi:hypothetical protein